MIDGESSKGIDNEHQKPRAKAIGRHPGGRYSLGGARPPYPLARLAVAVDGGPTDFLRLHPLHRPEPAGSRVQVSHDGTGRMLSEIQAEVEIHAGRVLGHPAELRGLYPDGKDSGKTADR